MEKWKIDIDRNRPDLMPYNYNRCDVYGVKVNGNVLPVFDAGTEHTVEVVMG